MKYTNKIIGIFIATAILSCQKPENPLGDLELDINLPAASTVIGFKFIDADSGEEIESLDALITGSGARRMADMSFKQKTTYKVQESFLNMIVVPNKINEPTETSPLKFTIEVKDPTYLPSKYSYEMSSTGEYFYDIKLVKNQNSTKDEGVQVIKGSIGKDEELKTIPNKNGNSIVAKFNSGSGETTLRYVDPFDEKAASTMAYLKIKGSSKDSVYTPIAKFTFFSKSDIDADVHIKLPNLPESIVTKINNGNARLKVYKESTDAEGNQILVDATSGSGERKNEKKNGCQLTVLVSTIAEWPVGSTLYLDECGDRDAEFTVVARSEERNPAIPNNNPDLSYNDILVTVKLYNQFNTAFFTESVTIGNFLQNYNKYNSMHPAAMSIIYANNSIAKASLIDQYEGLTADFRIDYNKLRTHVNPVKKLKMIAKCAGSNKTITRTESLYYKAQGAKDYELLGYVTKGVLRTHALKNGVTYDFKMVVDGVVYTQTETMSAEKSEFTITKELTEEQCNKF